MKKQIKVACFSSDTPKNKVLSSNGKSLDRYCVKCIPDEDLSTGNYICDLTFLIDDNIQDLLQEEAILKILMDYGNEIFRISKVTVGTRYIYVVARQITIADSLTLWLEDVRPTNLNGQGAVSWLLDNAQGKKEIQIISDIDAVATAYYQRMSLYKALHDNDNSFLNRWGGEIQRRGYTIYINKRIGIDRGFTIREGKNLTGFESASNIDNLVTRAIGQGYNGILGNYIDSPLIGSYNRIYTSVIKYDDIKVKDEYSEEGYDTLEQAQAELDRRIGEEFSKNYIDKIKASYTINFVQLEKTEEYKNYIVAEKLFIGDDCRVYIPKLNVDIKVRAMTKKYDVLAQQTKEIKLSNYIEVKPLSLKQIADKLESMDSTETILQLAKDNATSLIKGGLKNSYVIVRENEIIIGDTKDINTMNKVWRWNNGGLGFSNTGYYGQYGTAITQDGAIVADFITTGQLNAALIKTGVLMSANGQTWIDMNNGSFNFANNLTMDEEGNIVYKGTITGSYADLRDTLLINGKGGNGWAQILLRSSTGLEGNIYTGGEKSLNMFAPSGIYIGGYRAVLEDKDDKWKMWTTDGGKGKAIFFDAVNGKIYSEGMPLTLSALGGRVQTETNFYVKGSCNPISHATGGMDLGASNLRWYTLYCVTAINTSDKRYKKNIKYLDEDNRVPVSNFSSRTSSVNKDEYKYYDFIKNELKLAEYDYDRQDSTYRVEDHQIGFIAQDIINTEIGEKFCYELEEGLGFSATGYTSIIAKALQEAIQKIESLEKEIELLKTQQ